MQQKRQDMIIKLLLTLAVALFAFWRQPEMLLEPRFWAEEGTNYFAFAYEHSFLENLLSPQYGYYTLYNSIATSLATLVGLDYAPYVTTYLAFAVQVAVAAAVIWWKIPFLDSFPKKFIVALSLQYLAYSRIWVTTIGVQYWLCVLSLLILLQGETGNRRLSFAQQLILLHNGLTGVLTCFMIPAFALKAYATKSRLHLRQTMLLVGCAAVQVVVFAAAMSGPNSQMSRRLVYCDPAYMISKLLKFEFTVPFFGQYAFQLPSLVWVDEWVRLAAYKLFGEPVLAWKFNLLETLVGLMVALFLAVLFYYRRKNVNANVILVSLVMVTIFSTLFSVNMSGGPRYTFAPSVMIILFVVTCWSDGLVPTFLRGVVVCLVLISVAASLVDYRLVMRGMAYDPSWPKWRNELAQWRQNPTNPMQIWPPGWSMSLRPK